MWDELSNSYCLTVWILWIQETEGSVLPIGRPHWTGPHTAGKHDICLHHISGDVSVITELRLFSPRNAKITPFCSWDSRMKASYYENRASRWLKSYCPTFGGVQVQSFGFAKEFGSFQKGKCGKWIDLIRNSSLRIWGYGFFIAESFV